MRVLIINSEFPPVGGGAGNASFYLARELSRGNHEVAVLTARHANLPRDEYQAGVHVIRVPALRRRADRSGALEQLCFALGACLNISRIIRQHRPQVILAYFGMPCGLVAWIAKVIGGIPYVVSLRGGDVPGFRPYDFALYHALIGPLVRLVWSRADAVIANSAGLRDLANDFYAQVPIAVIPNGVDLEGFAGCKRAWDSPRLLFVGRLVHQKGLDLLFDALGRMRDLAWCLDIVGDGPKAHHLRDVARQYCMEERIRFLGWQKHDDLVQRYREANLFVFPSRHEGMPNAVLEAMACGLPIIASRIAGNEELVVTGQTGLLVEPDSVSELELALRSLLPDGERRRKMGLASRNRAELYYGWSQVAGHHRELLERVKLSA